MTTLENYGYPPIEFAKPGSVEEGWRDGRNIGEGYQRGVALEYGDMSKIVNQHPLFIKALAATAGRSVLDYKRIQNLFLILTSFIDKIDSQNIVEFGSFRGGSLMFMGTILQALYPGAHIYGHDTFTGMPVTDKQIDLHSPGDFSSTSVEEVREAIDKAGLKNITLVPGRVEDTFPAKIPADLRIGLAHIDLDIYHAIKHCQNEVWPFMATGGYVVYDDATASSCLGATQAVEELIRNRCVHSEQIFPHFVFRSGPVELR